MSNNKWIKLDGKKDPPSTEAIALWVKTNNVEWWAKGVLARIEFTGSKKSYVFLNPKDDVEIENATHYMLISKPTE